VVWVMDSDPFRDIGEALRDSFKKGSSPEDRERRRQSLADAMLRGMNASLQQMIDEWDAPPKPPESTLKRLRKTVWRKTETLRSLFMFPPFLIALIPVILSTLLWFDLLP